MKKIFSLAVLLLAGFTTASAQDTYSNDLMTNTSDINGTARYVGMGGATGALGGDISGISNNPAGIAGFNRSWASIGMGATIQAARPADEDARAHYSFDQLGFVVVLPKSENDRLNFAVNLQRKLNFNRSLIANNYGVGGLSQAAQLAGLMTDFYKAYTDQTYNLPNMSYSSGLYNIFDGEGGQLQYHTDNTSYLRSTSGSLYGLDFNISGAVHNRFFWGATFGLDFLSYKATTSYLEERTGFFNNQPIPAYEVQDYTLETYRQVSGTGFNFKIGAIICPIEENPFRFGVAIETPTWYSLKQKNVDMTIWSKWNNNGWDEPSQTYAYNGYDDGYYDYTNRPDDGYLEFNVRTPWKFRFSLADVHAGIVAWDVEYEYSMNNYTSMGYPTRESDRWEDQSISTDQDRAMNKMTKNITQGVHNVRVGLEVLPTEHLVLRAGYNFYSKPFKNNARFDQTIDSYAMYKVTGTEFMNLGATNIFTFGIGYHIKGFYANAAYKYRMQQGDFYAFDNSYQKLNDHENQFITEASSLKPVSCNLDRHDITITLGYEF
ncbi:MAG: hypothetical protein IJQ59_06340 [Bacteroidaceae bacterium]|nr:hypothetical protein [Bacteroidaceae bacterium]